MKTLFYWVLITFLCVPVLNAEARGRRPGGGGGGMGGGYRPRPSAPSARPNPRPSPRPAPGPRPGTRPNRPSPGPGPGAGAGRPGGVRPGPGPGNVRPTHPINKPGGRPNAGDLDKFIGAHPPGHFPGNPGHRPGYPGYHKAEFHQNIHNHYPYHPIYGYPFSKNWCAHFHWHYSNWPHWTVAATAVALTSYIGVPYSGYGSAEQIPYYPVEPAPPATYQESVQAPQEAVEAGQQANVPDDSQWMNLGNFGIIPYKATDMKYGIQLATTKDGVLRGIQWDMQANTSVELEGSIQKDTLRVAWQAKTANAPMFETSVDQLTQQESMVNVYDPISKSLVSWQLIQIDEKDLPAPN